MLHNELVNVSNGLLELELRSSLFHRSIDRSLLDRSLSRSVVRWLDRSLDRSLHRSIARSIGNVKPSQMQSAMFYNQCVIIPRKKQFQWHEGLLEYQSVAGKFIVWSQFCNLHVNGRLWYYFILCNAIPYRSAMIMWL